MPLVMTRPAANQAVAGPIVQALQAPKRPVPSINSIFNENISRTRSETPAVLPMPHSMGHLLRGGLALEGTHEGFGCRTETDLANLRAFALALASWRYQMGQKAAAGKGAIVWVQQGREVKVAQAVPAFGLPLDRFITVCAGNDRDALWSAEELSESQGVAAILVEVNRYDLIASRRLQLRLEQAAIANARVKLPPPLLFVLRVPRYGRKPLETPSASLTRWRISPSRYRPTACLETGQDWIWRWQLELFRQRGGEESGLFDLEWNCATHRFSLVAPLAD